MQFNSQINRILDEQKCSTLTFSNAASNAAVPIPIFISTDLDPLDDDGGPSKPLFHSPNPPLLLLLLSAASPPPPATTSIAPRPADLFITTGALINCRLLNWARVGSGSGPSSTNLLSSWFDEAFASCWTVSVAAVAIRELEREWRRERIVRVIWGR